ncbi:hypothetical protein OIU77_019595 [Salix suchowensis]|uniref:Uncharacterized protein n=1 Tax=Salix suchowensis TaxID=1278906 RepID=A0ABQ9CK08_9ROSI|nr:hypothetical protein OIU77_019595 [Salix suchowensis]
MELACASVQASCSLTVPASSITSRRRSTSLSFFRCSISNPIISSKLNGCSLPVKSARRRKSSLAAAFEGTTTVPSDCEGEKLSFSDSSEPSAFNDDENDGKMAREWNNLRPHFYKRSQERADSEDDPGKKHNLLRFARKFKEIDEDIQRHNELLGVIKNEPSELSEVVAKRRKDFTKEFFVHLFTVAQSYHDNPSDQNALAKLGNDCVAAVQAYDSATENMEALNAAEIKLQDIINSPSLDAACKKIDDLAEKNKLDSALVLMITKAWSAAKESNMTKDEVKDVLYHLYKTSVANLQRNVPKDIRILKYLLTIEDREEWLCALNDAFTQGEELEGKDVDSLYTTPEKLYSWIKVMVDAYHLSQEGTLMREARDLMNPKIIKKMEELKKVVKDHFM